MGKMKFPRYLRWSTAMKPILILLRKKRWLAEHRKMETTDFTGCVNRFCSSFGQMDVMFWIPPKHFSFATTKDRISYKIITTRSSNHDFLYSEVKCEEATASVEPLRERIEEFVTYVDDSKQGNMEQKVLWE